MRTKLAIVAMTFAAAACQHTPEDQPDRGLASVNVPVVTSANYVFDAAAPGGSLAPDEAARLDGWFQGLGLGYGDSVYVEGGYGSASAQVAQIAGRYGMLVQPGAPVMAGAVPSDGVRVVVNRRRAHVPNCPNWSVAAQPNNQNRTMSNYGCAVNANLAAMVADPVDLIHGREGSASVDATTAAKAIEFYRAQEPSGKRGLENISTKKGN